MAPRKSEAEKAATRSARNKRYQIRHKGQAWPERPALKITEQHLALSQVRAKPAEAIDVFRPAADLHPPSVGTKAELAMDSGVTQTASWAYGALQGALFHEGQFFLGYPYLAELALRPEYRKISETIATEATRRWIKIQSTSDDDDKADKIKALGDAMDGFRLRDHFRRACEKDGFFGRAHLYVDLGDKDDAEMQTSIGDGRDDASKGKIAKGSLKGFKVIEPVWCSAQSYNTTSPLNTDWYKPQAWLVQGKKVHASRLLTFIGREVPDLLKPAYAFGGLSMSQIAKPYVDNWLRTRQAVSDLVHSFSVSGIKTDLAEALQANAEGLFRRVALFNNTRDNAGTMLLDKEREDFFNVSTPLGTLDHLQAQAQEQMASIASIPLVKLLGITPSGLNASSDGEVRCFYDFIHAYQEHFFARHLDTVFALVQLHVFGEIDEDLTYKFEPLWTLDDKELAEVNEIEARTDVQLVEAGIITVEEARKRLAADPEVPYDGLDPDDLPDLPEPELEPERSQPAPAAPVDAEDDDEVSAYDYADAD